MKKSLLIALVALSGYASAQTDSEASNPLATPPVIEKTVITEQAASADTQDVQEEAASEAASEN